MSDPQSQPPNPQPQPRQLSGCAAAFLILIGIVMLLPGLCSLAFLVVALTTGELGGDIISLFVFTFMLAGLGIVLIRSASKSSRPPQ